MKKILLAFFILFQLAAQGQTDTAIAFGNVVKVDSVSADDLFLRAKRWFAAKYTNSDAATQYNENYELTANGAIKYGTSSFFKRSASATGFIRYVMKVTITPEGYSYKLSNFVHEGSAMMGYPGANFELLTSSENCPDGTIDKSWNLPEWYDKIWKELKSEAAKEADSVNKSLQKAMHR